MTIPSPMPIPAALRTVLILCSVALAAAAAIVIATQQIRRDADTIHTQLAARLDGIHRQQDETLKTTADARDALRQLSALQQLGLKAPAPRLQLTSGIDAALTETGLADLRYTLSSPLPLGDTPLLTYSSIQLTGNLPHEGRLLALLGRLEATGYGAFLPLMCTLARTPDDAHTIVKANCEAIWLGLQPPS